MPKSSRSRVVIPVGSKSSLNQLIRSHSKQMVRCPTCLERLSLEDYVHKHVLERHGWNHNRVCIYCSGGERWPPRKRNFKHIVPCLKRFLEGRVPCAIEKPLPKVLKPCQECQKFSLIPRDMCGRGEKEDMSDYMGLYESWYERPEAYGESDITFTEESGLGCDIYAIVQRYLKRDLKWYHLMVIQDNFRNFVEAFDKMKHRMFLLPFWCLCDGLTMNRRTHRHMIMAVEPNAPFKSIWTKEVKYKLKKSEKSKKLIRIKSAFHLIRVIQYVSQRKASCDEKRMRVDVSEYSHFYINRPLYEHAIVYMSMMFRGGLQCLVDEQTKNKDIVGWLKHIRRVRTAQRNLQYAVPIGETGFKFLNCVLPLSREFVPSEEETPLFLHWIGDKKLYLKIDRNLENLSREEWFSYQAVKGNTVSSISEELYVLYPGQQNVMKQIKMALDEKEETDKRIREEMCRIYDARITALEVESADMRQEMNSLKKVKSENDDLRRQMQIGKSMFSKISWMQNESNIELANWVLANMSLMNEMKQFWDQVQS